MKIRENATEFDLGDYEGPGAPGEIQLSVDEKHARVLCEDKDPDSENSYQIKEKDKKQIDDEINASLGLFPLPIYRHGGYAYYGPKEEIPEETEIRAGSPVTPQQGRRYDLWKAIIAIKNEDPDYLIRIAEAVRIAVEEDGSRSQLAKLIRS